MSDARDLVWLDMEPLLEKARNQCKGLENQLEEARKDLDIFKTQWEPAYMRWFNSGFGEMLTEFRELESKSNQLIDLIEAVEYEAFVTSCSERTAYRRIEKERREADELHEKLTREREEQAEPKAKLETEEEPIDPSSSSENEDHTLPPGLEGVLKSGFDRIFGGRSFSPEEYEVEFAAFKERFKKQFFNHGSDHFHGDGNGSNRYGNEDRSFHRKKKTKEPAGDLSENQRLKQIYRELARKLHPDLNPSLSKREKDLWNEVQAHYENRNLEELETLAAILDSSSALGYLKIQSVSRVLAVYNEFKKKLKSTQKSLRAAKKTPSWNFNEVKMNPVQLQTLETKTRKNLGTDLQNLVKIIEAYEEQIESWKAPSRQTKRRNQNKSKKNRTNNFY